jgi:hypothetical protein
MNSGSFDWRVFLRSQRSCISIIFIEGFCLKWYEVKEPTLKHIEQIPYDELLNACLSMPTVHEIQLLQQEIRKQNDKT